MSHALFILDVASRPGHRITLPALARAPVPGGRRLRNGTLIVTDESNPDVLYKFIPWSEADLAWNELDTYSRLHHGADMSHIVRLLGVTGTREHLVQQMERSHLGTLDAYLMAHTRGAAENMPSALLRQLLSPIAMTMAHLHAMNLLHRDLKAENILVFEGAEQSPEWQAITARLSDFDRAVELVPGDFLTEPVGSLFHMAPELLAWERYDRKVDVYAFGILMFEMAHGGSRPHSNVATCMPDSISRTEFAQRVVDEDLRPHWTHPDVELLALARRCWSKTPDDRPEFSEIVRVLGALAEPRTEYTPQAALARLQLSDTGISSDVGKQREHMEDASCLLRVGDTLIAGVFDGLRGSRCSEFAARRLALAVNDVLSLSGTSARSALEQAFAHIDTALQAMEPPVDCGSTATVAVLQASTFTVAWLGDSPAVVFRSTSDQAGYVVEHLVAAHHPDRQDEATRIAAQGGSVRREQRWLDSGETIPIGPARVFVAGRSNGIALSRALGLNAFKPVVSGTPELREYPRHEDDLYAVLGSDGVFDLLTPDILFSLISAATSMQCAADAILAEVLQRGAHDNASVVVIDLRARP